MALSLQEKDAEVLKRKAEEDEKIPDSVEEYLEPVDGENGFSLMRVDEFPASPAMYKAFIQSYQEGRTAQVYLDETEGSYQTAYVNVDDPEVGQEGRWEKKIMEMLER
ncbi:MAG: hypothetical protein ABEK00_03515 [Candidatus Nanohaloarchaea archaeon]